MPRPGNLIDLEIDLSGGYFPSAQALSPAELQRTIRRALNCWLRSGGRVEVANGLSEVSSTNVGARLFAADIQRASIEGGLSGSRLPFGSVLRYQNAAFFFLSENTSAQVYLNETAITGLTTSSSAGRLRVGVPDGLGGYDTYDAGFDKPTLEPSEVAVFTVASGLSGNKPMSGAIGVAIAPWRIATGAVGPPSETVYNDVPQSSFPLIRLGQVSNLPAPQSGQDGWIYCGTRWDDRSGELHVVRYMRIAPRGTYAATNGSVDVAGSGTFWTEDLRRGDIFRDDISGVDYQIDEVNSDASITLSGAFAGSTGSGKTMTLVAPAANWYDSELGALVPYDVFKPPRAAGVHQYAGRVLLWGALGESESSATGPAILACLDNNPEHVGVFAIITASGSDLVNVLGADGPLYLMTTTSLEVVTFTGDPATPYVIRIVAEPGFKATSNGCLYKDWFYGFNAKPLRTRARENIDVEFAEPVWEDMRDWDAQRVVVAVDPENDAVLYVYDNGETTTVIPFMAQLGVWGLPLGFEARIIDAAVVNGKLYVTYLSSGNYRVNEWEGGTEIEGEKYIATQYYNSNLNRGRLKNLVFTGKAGTLYVFAATPGAAVPDVSDSLAAIEPFTLSDTDCTEPEIFTNIEARAFAFRIDFPSADGKFDNLVTRWRPKAERR